MRAQDIMTTPPVAVTLGSTVGEAAAAMTAHGFTALPIVDSEGRLLGLLTESALDGTRHPADSLSRDNDAGRELPELANRMIETRLRSMVVLKGGRVAGIVTFQDVLSAISAARNA
ncbi:HPP family protein [Amycolatopsis sp. NPDC059657]|uniref:CBS domain-containing protein n=1 Tax=Amycolatopsis sp. NPDC059657 TaxID=3346899 RepID=UPI0036730392